MKQKVSSTALGGASVLVITVSRAQADQWAARLHASDFRVTLLAGSSTYLLAMDEAGGSNFATPGVTIATVQLLAAKGDHHSLSNLEPALLVLDGVPSRADGVLGRTAATWINRADQTVAVLGPGDDADNKFEKVLEYRLSDAVRDWGRAPTVVCVGLESDPVESRLREDVKQFLGTDSIEGASASLSYLHALLSAEAESVEHVSKHGADSSRATHAIDLLERLEALEWEPRAQAVIAVAEQTMSENRPLLITANRLSDAEYVADILRMRDMDVSIVNSSVDFEQRQVVLETFGPGKVLVRGNVEADWLLPDRTRLLWWSRPSKEALIRDIAQAVFARGTELVTLDPEVERDVTQLLAAQ
ncbi:hypothetical protein KZX45_09775 [Georgenia sp. EYE_87]|uniref:hypothetical protein n=1 Tax=Georgenia sp. EYE_87 TaxID=2853448 RepID=UPI0020060B6B|nr:hypothetical protein [Georgenia sp. EYE_87]MCK6210829.1 hypothetical protein [Georgenia sp. EYE_87]